MKLYLTLEDNDGQKVERVYKLGQVDIEDESGYLWDAVASMIDSIKKSKKPL